MANTLFYAGISIVGIIAIVYAIADCIRMRIKGIKKMDRGTEEFMERFILKLAGAETLVLIFVISASIILWRSMTTMDPSDFTFMCGVVYLVMWLDLVMMSFTFSLTYQVKLSRDGQQ